MALCPLGPEHLAKAQEWINQEEVRQYLHNVVPIGELQEKKWLERLAEAKDEFCFAVHLKAGGEHVGNCGLHRVDWVNRAAEYGIVIGEPNAQNKGYGTEVTKLVLRYAFEQLNLNRVQLRVYEYNARAVKCYEKAGYRLEGRLRQARFWRGRYWEVLLMAVLREEFPGRGV